MRPLYIFDLDGTLAHIEHRRHFVEDGATDWTSFYAACVDDTPNQAVLTTLLLLAREADIWIWSGRSDAVRAQTEAWLHTHGLPFGAVTKGWTVWHKLKMRKHGDHQPDDKLKMGWLHAMPANDRARLVAVFDDRDRLVQMWRASGVPCFQVAPGNF